MLTISGGGKVIHANGNTNSVVIENYTEGQSLRISAVLGEFAISVRRGLWRPCPQRAGSRNQYGFYKGGNKRILLKKSVEYMVSII